MSPPPAIVLDRVTLAHGSAVVLRDLSGLVPSGSLTAVMGANGAGKTTLLRAIAGLHPLAAGRIACDRTRLALLPQASQLDRGFPISCRDVVALGAWRRLGPFRAGGTQLIAQAMAALDQVGMAAFAHRPIGRLSSGQLQRVLFARLIVQTADIILLDEPFAGVDAETTVALIGLIRAWHSEGRTILIVLHDRDQARDLSPRTLLLGGPSPVWGSLTGGPDDGMRVRAA